MIDPLLPHSSTGVAGHLDGEERGGVGVDTPSTYSGACVAGGRGVQHSTAIAEIGEGDKTEGGRGLGELNAVERGDIQDFLLVVAVVAVVVQVKEEEEEGDTGGEEGKEDPDDDVKEADENLHPDKEELEGEKDIEGELQRGADLEEAGG